MNIQMNLRWHQEEEEAAPIGTLYLLLSGSSAQIEQPLTEMGKFTNGLMRLSDYMKFEYNQQLFIVPLSSRLLFRALDIAAHVEPCAMTPKS